MSAEIQYLEQVAIELFDEARKKGVYVIECCGYDCIVSDCGVMYLKDKYPDIRFNQVESYFNDQGPINRPINHGTFDSIILSIAKWRDLRPLIAQSSKKFHTKPYQPQRHLKRSMLPRKGPVLNKWSVPFWPADQLIVNRSQMMSYAQDPMDYPIQMKPYMYIPHLALYFVMGVALPIFFAMIVFGPTFRLLTKYPHVFTLGKITRNDPSDEPIRTSTFEQHLVGKGWYKNELNGQEPNTKPTVTKVLRVSGPEVAYMSTSIMLLCSAITILEDLEPQSEIQPGVLTPGFAFRKSKLIERLARNGIQYKEIDVNHKKEKTSIKK